MIEPEWITEEDVVAIHLRQISEHGGGSGIHDIGLLQSAMERPQNASHYNNVVSLTSLAAAYMFGIAKNHAFVDGNKRTAYVVARTFLILNGFDISASKEEKYLTVYSLAEGMLTEDELADWLESKAVKI